MGISQQLMVEFTQWHSEQVLGSELLYAYGSEKQDFYVDFLYSHS